jgi:hypothetical protein
MAYDQVPIKVNDLHQHIVEQMRDPIDTIGVILVGWVV